MKKLLTILCIVCASCVQAQTVSTVEMMYDPQRGTIWIEKPAGDPITFAQDTFRLTDMINGKQYIKFKTTAWKFSDFGISPASPDVRQRLQSALNRGYVSSLEGDSDSARAYRFTGKLNGNGKTLSFRDGTYLQGNTNTDTLDNANLKAGTRQRILSRVKLGKNVTSDAGAFSVMWTGVNPDSTADANMDKLHRWMEFTEGRDSIHGVHVRFPWGVYNMKRYTAYLKMIEPGSYSKWSGEAGTTLRLDDNARWNNSRFFYIGNGKRNITIEGFSFDGNNFIPHYDSIPTMLLNPDGVTYSHDAQGAFIMTYSSDSLNPVRNIKIRDCAFRNAIGENINVSRNSRNITVMDCYQGGHLRQGLGIGGGNVDGLFVINYFDLEGETYICPDAGGNSIHCEPADVQKNLHFKNVRVKDVSLANVYGGSCENVITTRSDYPFILNFVSFFNVFNCNIAGSIQCTPRPEGAVNISNNPSIKGDIILTSVAGYSDYPKRNGAFLISENFVYGTIQNNIIDSVDVIGNYIFTQNKTGIMYSNQGAGNILDNEINIGGTGNYANIYVYATQSYLYGSGVINIDRNRGRGPWRGIYVNSKTVMLGINNFDVPTPLSLNSLTKVIPYMDGSGKQILNTTALPNYWLWKVGDIINIPNGLVGGYSEYFIRTAGALVEGTWSSAGTYYLNNWVRDTALTSPTIRYYKSIKAGGQAERPRDDADNTYWVQVSTSLAQIQPKQADGMVIAGLGDPNGSVIGWPGMIYLRRNPTDTSNIVYGKLSGEGTTANWVTLFKSGGGGGGTGGMTESEVINIVNGILTSQVDRGLWIKKLSSIGDTLLKFANDSTLIQKTLVAGANTTITKTDSTIIISSAGGGGVGGTDTNYVKHKVDSLGNLIGDTLTIRNAMTGDTLARFVGSTMIVKSLIAGFGLSFGKTDTTITIRTDTTNNGVATYKRLKHVTDSLAALIVAGGGSTGTVNNSAAGNRLAIYPAAGTTVGPHSALTANKALGTDGSGLPAASTASTTDLNNIAGLSSNAQTQLNGKVPAARTLTINGVQQDLSADRNWTFPTFGDNIYNPTISNLSDVSTISIDSVGWLRLGNSVQVWGGGFLNSVAASGNNSFEMTLPVSVSFPASVNHLGGGGTIVLAAGTPALYISPVPGTNRVKIAFTSPGISPGVFSFNFGFRIYNN